MLFRIDEMEKEKENIFIRTSNSLKDHVKVIEDTKEYAKVISVCWLLDYILMSYKAKGVFSSKMLGLLYHQQLHKLTNMWNTQILQHKFISNC